MKNDKPRNPANPFKGIYLNGSAYVVRIRKRGQAAYSKNFHFYDNEDSKRKALTEAMNWQDRELKSIEHHGIRSDSDIHAITLLQALEFYEKEGVDQLKGAKQERSLVKRAKALVERLELDNKTIAELKEDDFELIRDDLQEQELENATINRTMNVFAATYNHLREQKKIRGLHFFKGLRLPVNDRKMITTNYETVKSVIALIDSPKTQAGIELLYLTGARRSEMALAKAEWVDLDNGLVNIPVTKNSDPRSLFLNSRAKEILNGLLGDRKTGYIFTDDPTGKTHWHIDTFSRAWGRGRQRLYEKTKNESVLKVSLHTLRHSFISEMVLVVDNTMKQMTLSGHKTVTMLKRYSHIDNIKLHKEIGHLLEKK